MMSTRTPMLLRLGPILAAAIVALGLLLTGPAAATEGPAPTDAPTEPTGEEGGAEHGEEEGSGKIELPLDTERPRDAIGLVMLGVVAAGVALAFVNMRRQLKGERGQATGEWRYR
ncbi:MAG: hypothetical protein KY469_02125 [Actinobacteria bacterium]|nr:hypothetical protein [Actinomycetota bacterium]